MKQTVSKIFLLIFLLNAVGYYGFYLGLKASHDNSFAEKLDEGNYSGNEAFIFKIPLSVPYHADNNEYERVQGQFEKDSEIFQLVKQKLLRDTLYVVCVKDNHGKKINQDLADYVKTFSDKPSDNTHSRAKPFFDYSKDYFSSVIAIRRSSFGWEKKVALQTSLLTFIPSFHSSIVHPPERISFV